MDSIKKASQIVKQWYTKYLVSTELYMVEPWERVFIHVLFIVFFVCFWYFNYSIILNGIAQLKDSSQHVAEL